MTHLLRNNIANFVVECIIRAQNNPLQTARKKLVDPAWISVRSKLSEDGSDAAKVQNKINNARLRQQCSRLNKANDWQMNGMVVLGLATSHHDEIKTDAGTPDWPSLVSPSMVSVFVGRRLTMTLLPPANYIEVQRQWKSSLIKTGSFTSLQMFHTHTHTLTHLPTYIPTYIPPSSLHHSRTSSSLLAFSAQSKSKEVGNMWGYPVL